MNREEMYATVRRLTGGKTRNELPDAVLEPYLDGSLEWLAAELRYRIDTDTQALGLVADQQEILLPADLIEVIFIEWNSTRLVAGSVYAWDRQGITWRNATSGTPSEFAVQGRHLVLNPPPGDDAIDDDATLTLRGVFMPEKMGVDGPVDLPPLDHRLACWKSAKQWLIVNPTQENLVRAQAYETEIAPLLASAKRRAGQMIRSYRPRWRVRSYRQGGAR